MQSVGCWTPWLMNDTLKNMTTDAEFVLGSAFPHNYDLVLGSHSVHTSAMALREAETRISKIQTRLIQQGRL